MDFERGFVVTGSIGCGKSSFCNLLKRYGFDVIDADEIAHEQLQGVACEVAELFGDMVVQGGVVDRTALGAIIFSDNKAKKKLEELLHPRIKSEILSKSSALEKLGKPYFIDIPLYYEAASYEAKKVIVVYAPRSVQFERLTTQKGMSIDDANARINSQIDIEKKRKMADMVIDNSSDLGYLEVQTQAFIRNLSSDGICFIAK
jgi:dephospho-CoA kinase